ncbi:unnamed protein product [Phytophthora fragariaefolia]|uniref:Unnamed protein product n=1 Tax=Phytophthora fragariaefolia TaxID=1490495 RepID=A0A9W6XWY4_9STRA|nr:unnamed protein product [Phytophthora fragariaefolia]
MATDGIVPPWINPDARCGVRPLPDNYVGAASGAPVAIDKLLAGYYKGRCLVATLATLQWDPGFHSSTFALVNKKDIPLHMMGALFTTCRHRLAVRSMTRLILTPLRTPRGIHLIPSLNLCATYVAGTLGPPSTPWSWISRTHYTMSLFMLTTHPFLGKNAAFHPWHSMEGNVTTWSWCFHAVGIDWDIPNELISVPQQKIKKMRGVLDDVARRKFVTMKQLDNLVGGLRYVISFIPVTKSFIQQLVVIQIICQKHHEAGVPMMDALQKDI